MSSSSRISAIRSFVRWTLPGAVECTNGNSTRFGFLAKRITGEDRTITVTAAPLQAAILIRQARSHHFAHVLEFPTGPSHFNNYCRLEVTRYSIETSIAAAYRCSVTIVGFGAVLFSSRDKADLWMPVRPANSFSDTPVFSRRSRNCATSSAIAFRSAFSFLAIDRAAAMFSSLPAISSATARWYFACCSAVIFGKFVRGSGFNMLVTHTLNES